MAHAVSCSPWLDGGSIFSQGTLVGRVVKDHYSPEVLEKYRQIRKQNQLQVEQVSIATAADGKIVWHLHALVNSLRASSGLSGLNDRPPLKIQIASSKQIPFVHMRGGVLLLNYDLLRLFRSDDEIAGFLGNFVLQDALAVDLRLLQVQLPRWQPRSVIRLRQARVLKQKERELLNALPVLLSNAGFDPWAPVDFDRRLIEAAARSRPDLLHQLRGHLEHMVSAMENHLTEQGIRRVPELQHKHSVLRQIRRGLPL